MKKTKLNDLKHILKAIRKESIEYGVNRKYCFVIDEDGELVFLKRNDKKSEHFKDLQKSKEKRNQWPENSYDGEVIFKINTYEDRGIKVTEEFLHALKIEYMS